MKILPVIMACIMTSAVNATSLDLSEDAVADIERLLAHDSARAVVVGLYDSGETKVFGFGQLSRTGEHEPDANSVFEIGSISKVFTSLLVQVLVDDGVLDWNQSIGSFLPDLKFGSPAVAAITLRELSMHSSGLPSLPDNIEMTDPTDPYAGYGHADLMAFLVSFKPDTLTKEYGYSNLGAGLLGTIAADAASTSYADAMQLKVLRPLELLDTQTSLRDDQRNRLATGFSDGADMPNWGGFDALAGAGALLSTADNLLSFIHQNMSSSALKNSLAAIRQRQDQGPTALGWHVAEVNDGEAMLWHNGGTGGYTSFLAVRPDTGTGIVILATSTAYDDVTNIGMAEITGQPRVAGLPNADSYVGAYELADGFILTVYSQDDHLYGQATGQGPFPLKHESGDEFSYEASGIELRFQRDDSGVVNAMTFLQAGREMAAPKVDDTLGVSRLTAIVVDAEELQHYVGKYRLDASAVLTVERRRDQLFVQLTGQQAFPVFPYETDRFFYKVVDAQLHFERGEDGEVDAVVLDQSGQRRAPKVGQ